MRFAAPRRPDPLIDVTPMIDVVFQLVLFFMVTTTFASSPAFQVDLPRADADVVPVEEDDVEIWLGADGRLEVDGAPADAAALGAALDRAAARDPATLVILRADAEVSHGRVVSVMDAARGRGLTRLAVATRPDDPSAR